MLYIFFIFVSLSRSKVSQFDKHVSSQKIWYCAKIGILNANLSTKFFFSVLSIVSLFIALLAHFYAQTYITREISLYYLDINKGKILMFKGISKVRLFFNLWTLKKFPRFWKFNLLLSKFSEENPLKFKGLSKDT